MTTAWFLDASQCTDLLKTFMLIRGLLGTDRKETQDLFDSARLGPTPLPATLVTLPERFVFQIPMEAPSTGLTTADWQSMFEKYGVKLKLNVHPTLVLEIHRLLSQASVAEIKPLARFFDIKNRSKMNKTQLIEAIAKALVWFESREMGSAKVLLEHSCLVVAFLS